MLVKVEGINSKVENLFVCFKLLFISSSNSTNKKTKNQQEKKSFIIDSNCCVEIFNTSLKNIPTHHLYNIHYLSKKKNQNQNKKQNKIKMSIVMTPNEVKGLLKYKYNGGDTSLIYYYILSPLAQYLVDNYIPSYIAPNLITFIGFLFSFLSFILTILYNYDLNSNGPNWLPLIIAINLFIYQTLDNMDGKQVIFFSFFLFFFFSSHSHFTSLSYFTSSLSSFLSILIRQEKLVLLLR